MLLRFQQVPNLKSCYYLRLEGKIGCWSCFGPVALVVFGYSSGPVGSCESGPFRRLLAMAALPRVLYRNPANGLDVLSLPHYPPCQVRTQTALRETRTPIHRKQVQNHGHKTMQAGNDEWYGESGSHTRMIIVLDN